MFVYIKVNNIFYIETCLQQEEQIICVKQVVRTFHNQGYKGVQPNQVPNI